MGGPLPIYLVTFFLVNIFGVLYYIILLEYFLSFFAPHYVPTWFITHKLYFIEIISFLLDWYFLVFDLLLI